MAIKLSDLFPSGTITINYQFAQNQTYIVDNEFTLSGTNTFGSGCILIFQGGCFKGTSTAPAILEFNGCKIEGSGVIFKGDYISISDSNTVTNKLYNTALLAEWFGVTPYSGDVTSAINKAISACYASNVHNLLFSSGSFTVNGTVNVGQTTSGQESYNTRYWDIKIIGTGNYTGRCTSFYLGTTGKFVIDMINRNIGTFRSGYIQECSFRADSSRTTSAILIKRATTYEFRKCHFVYFDKGIELQGACYYVNIRMCTFDHCNYGVKSTNDPTDSTPNNNMIYGCMFTNCDNPADLSEGHCWHIIDSDFEGGNGTIKLSPYGRMTNVRIERNKQDATWLEIPNGCEVDAGLYHNTYSTNETWRCICTGDYNRVRLRMGHAVKYGLISYGKGNEFFITNESKANNLPTIYIFNPEDKFVLDGCSNQSDYLGENLVTGTSLILDTNGTAQTCIDGNCYPTTGSTSNITFKLFEATKKLYKTCLFFIDSTATTEEIQVGLFETFKMKKQAGWYIYASAINKDSSNISTVSVGNNTTSIYTPITGQKLYIRDVVISTLPLYKRPVLNTIERNTYNQLQQDGIIHLASTYLNYVTTTFCLIRSNNQLYKNKLGKTFRRTAAGDYVCDGYKVATSLSGVNYNSGSDGNLSGVMSGMIKTKVELIGTQDGYSLCLDAVRNTTSEIFVVNVLSSVGMTYLNNNQYGTIAISEKNRVVTAWVMLL